MNRNYSLLLLCLFGILACLVVDTFGHETLLDGSSVSDISQFPYQVSVQVRKSNGRFAHKCGGGIIGDRFILTAAHCVFKPDHSGIDNEPLSILAATNNLNETDRPALRVAVRKVFVPKNYNSADPTSSSDIAVLMLNRTLGISLLRHNKSLKKLTLPSRSTENYTNQEAVIAGFGYNGIKIIKGEERGSTDGYLRSAKVEICGKCDHHESISDKQFCAKVQPQTKIRRPIGTCTGDSGGPLVQNGKYVIGILILSAHVCLEHHDGSLYTRVSDYLEFIKLAMKNREAPNICTLEL